MKAAIIIFPGSNCDQDMRMALDLCGFKTQMIWHQEKKIPKLDLIVLPGGFSYGDYLRCGAMAAKSPIMKEVIKFAQSGGKLLGVCNGFQILLETGLLKGTLIRNENLKFICKEVTLNVTNNKSPFTKLYENDERVIFPIAHHDGNYFVEDDGLKEIEDNNQVAFRYENDDVNPNGSVANIAGIFNKRKNILGLMPHPERVIDKSLGGTDGIKLFQGLVS